MNQRSYLSDKHLAAERERFAGVMAARKTPQDFIGLAERLAESTKFAIEAKPHCLADFIQTSATRVPDAALDALLVALQGVWAGDLIRGKFNDADTLLRPLVRRALETAKTGNALAKRLRVMWSARIVESPEHALELALAAGLSRDKVPTLRSMLEALAARPKAEEPCPF
ncbi:hypothetical protein P5X00_36975 [Paraburkholderia sp. A2RO-4L]|uniref:hypothetical protein n=1 Tax=Paraburkholderia sp. A2RO-4L TaxID=3028374 RepID=UPI003DA96614